MRESVAEFTARTGLAYAPDEELLAWGRPLAIDEECPTLFRYPGPCGVRDVVTGRGRALGAPASRVVWLSCDPVPLQAPSAARFGTLAVLRPLRLGPVASDEPGVYVAWNAATFAGGAVGSSVAAADEVIWVPPTGFALDWDRIATADAVRAALPGWDSARDAVLADLDVYDDEVRRLHEAGGEHPDVKWAEVPPGERRRLLARLGVEPLWSAAA